MIPHGVEVFVALDPVNMHLSFDRLAGRVTERTGRAAPLRIGHDELGQR